jgi:ribosomal protein S18 acetylase RimI-like enzyme
VRVRQLRAGDQAELLRAATLFDRPPVEVAARAYLDDPRNVVLLAHDDTTPVGYLRGTALAQIASVHPQMILYDIRVAPASRRRGVGRALIAALLAYGREHRVEEVFVLTDPANVAAVGLYRATRASPETPADRMFVYRLGTDVRPLGSDPPA